MASRGLALGPRPPHTAALRGDRERTGPDDQLDERGPPGEWSARYPGWRIIVKTCKSQCHCNSVCVIINASAAVLCCIAVAHRGRVGWCVGGLLGRWVGVWVDGRVCSWLRVFDVFRTFVFWTLGAFTALSRPLPLLYVICCTAVIHAGWVDRFVGVTVVLRSAVLL